MPLDGLLYPKRQPPWLLPAGQFELDRSHPLTAGLVGFWPLNGDARDYSKTGAHGILTNYNGVNPASTMTRFGPALMFTDAGGSNNEYGSYVAIGQPPALDFTGPCSTSAWIYGTGANAYSTGGCTIFSKGYRSSANSTQWALTASSAHPNFGVYYNGTGYGATSTITLSTNTWYHLVGTFDGTAWRLYINGALDTTFASTQGPVHTTAGVAISGADTGGDVAGNVIQKFGGIISGVGAWNRALTAKEIKRLYAEPFGMLRPVGRRSFPVPPYSGPPIGTLAVTQANQTLTATGTVPVTGTLATTQADQILGHPFNLTTAFTQSVPTRTDFTGTLGMAFTPSTNVTFNKVGVRTVPEGTDTGVRTIRFYRITGSGTNTYSCVETNTWTIDLTGYPAGAFAYTSIPPLTLTAGSTYFIGLNVTIPQGYLYGNTTLQGVSRVTMGYIDPGAPTTINLDLIDGRQYTGLDLAYDPAARTGKLVTSFTSGLTSSGFDNWYLGMQFIPQVDMTFNKIGVLPVGSNITQPVGLFTYGVNTPLRTANVAIGQPVWAGEFYYADIAPITLTAGTAYLLGAQVIGGYYWLDRFPVTLRNAGNVRAAYFDTTTPAFGAGTPADTMFYGVDLAFSLPNVTGNLAVTQGANTLVASGTVGAAGAITGNLSVTQANQTLVAAGGPTVAGALTATQANQTLVATAGPVVGGLLGVTQANQTLVATAGPVVGGLLGVTQANQTLAGTAIIGPVGNLALTQANQTLVAAGTPTVTGALSLIQGNQTLAALANVAPLPQTRVVIMA